MQVKKVVMNMVRCAVILDAGYGFFCASSKYDECKKNDFLNNDYSCYTQFLGALLIEGLRNRLLESSLSFCVNYLDELIEGINANQNNQVDTTAPNL